MVCAKPYPWRAHILCRSIILKAFIEGGMKKTDAESVRMYDKALAILRWGREQWCDIPREERGTVFDDTFVRGVRHLRLDFYMNVRASPVQLSVADYGHRLGPKTGTRSSLLWKVCWRNPTVSLTRYEAVQPAILILHSTWHSTIILKEVLLRKSCMIYHGDWLHVFVQDEGLLLQPHSSSRKARQCR